MYHHACFLLSLSPKYSLNHPPMVMPEHGSRTSINKEGACQLSMKLVCQVLNGNVDTVTEESRTHVLDMDSL